MTDVYASGQWYVKSGQEGEFVARWQEYVSWGQRAHAQGFERARLLRDEEDGTHFVSLLEWDDAAARAAWGSDPELARHLSPLEELCREVHTSRYEEAVTLG